jgi:hypothetical protein
MGDTTSQIRKIPYFPFAYGRKALLENGRTWQAILQAQVLL